MLKKKRMIDMVFSGFVWKFAERISAQFVTFIVSIVLARLLTPNHYGSIAIVNVFIALANVFVVSGFGNSLIQKKDADNLDFSSVFYFNIFMSIFMYGIVFVCAPYISMFYSMPELTQIFRVIGLRLIVAGINSVQHAYVARHMLFKRFFWSTLGGTLISGVVGIVMAYNGFGLWSLVTQYMVNTTVDTIVLWITVKWRPQLIFSLKRLRHMFSYGWKLLLSSLLETGYVELRSLVIGKMYTSSDLAHYNKGNSFPNLIVTNINSSIQSVLFPAMSNCQDEKQKIKTMCRRSIRISSYIMLPLMVGLALIAKPFILLVLTEKWLPCVPYVQISCFTMAFIPIHTANLQAIKAIGRSDTFLKLEIAKKIIGLMTLILVAPYGVMAIASSLMVTTVISSILNAFPNKKLIDYGYFEQIKDLFNGIVPLCVMTLVVWLIGLLNMESSVLMLVQILIGMIVYIVISFITKNESFIYVLSLLKKSIWNDEKTQIQNSSR